jgi:hypothetical protein
VPRLPAPMIHAAGGPTETARGWALQVAAERRLQFQRPLRCLPLQGAVGLSDRERLVPQSECRM